MAREIKLLPNICAINYQPHESEMEHLRSLNPRQYAEQMRELLSALDETNRVLRNFGFRTTLKIAWAEGNSYEDPSEAIIDKVVSI